MELRTFIGSDLQETLAKVKKELGPEALILSTQSRRPTANRGLGLRREIEVTAAVQPTSGSAPGRPLSADGTVPSGDPLTPAPISVGSRALKGLRAGQWEDTGVPPFLAAYPDLASFSQKLARLGVSPAVLEKWLKELARFLAAGAGLTPGRAEALNALMQIVAVVDPWQTPVAGPRCWILLGTTGVGKTTTLAKMAVHASLVRRERVGLISLDQQRLGAMEQLAAFGRLTDLPLLPVNGPEELMAALDAFRHLDCIFIDTPGQNPRAPHLGQELKALFQALPQAQCHLLISAGTAESLIAATLRSFGAIPLTSLILTKTDESQDLAGCFNQICLSGLPLSFITTGPGIPEDLEPASASRLVSLLLEPEGSPGGAFSPGSLLDEASGYASQ